MKQLENNVLSLVKFDLFLDSIRIYIIETNKYLNTIGRPEVGRTNTQINLLEYRWMNISEFEYIWEKIFEQAGAELCQAQYKL